MMRKISANYIFPISSPPVNNTYLVIDNYGYIIDMVSHDLSFSEVAGLEYYSGIIIPAFVLAYENLAPVEFISAIKPTQKAERIAWQNGIQATGSFSCNANLNNNFKASNFLDIFHDNENASFEQILYNITLNGAKTLLLDNKFGSLEKNKTPGLLLLEGYNYSLKTLTTKATLQRLV